MNEENCSKIMDDIFKRLLSKETLNPNDERIIFVNENSKLQKRIFELLDNKIDTNIRFRYSCVRKV